MKSLLSILTTVCLLISGPFGQAQPEGEVSEKVQKMVQHLGQSWAAHAVHALHGSLKVGDCVIHKISVGQVSAKMTLRVREETDEGFWLEQVFIYPETETKFETLFAKNDGHFIRQMINGEESQAAAVDLQAKPDTVISAVAQVQVEVPQRVEPYEATQIDFRSAEGSEYSTIWLNPHEVPLTGILKMVGQFAGQPFQAELESFARGQ